jgi:hypothetical protein
MVAVQADVVMAVVRVKAPAEVDPYLIGAELTRAICNQTLRDMTAEVTLLSAGGARHRRQLRHHGFVAVLQPSAKVTTSFSSEQVDVSASRSVLTGGRPAQRP